MPQDKKKASADGACRCRCVFGGTAGGCARCVVSEFVSAPAEEFAVGSGVAGAHAHLAFAVHFLAVRCGTQGAGYADGGSGLCVAFLVGQVRPLPVRFFSSRIKIFCRWITFFFS